VGPGHVLGERCPNGSFAVHSVRVKNSLHPRGSIRCREMQEGFLSRPYTEETAHCWEELFRATKEWVGDHPAQAEAAPWHSFADAG
jgi:hypothetical protein